MIFIYRVKDRCRIIVLWCSLPHHQIRAPASLTKPSLNSAAPGCPPPFFFACARIDCELHSGNSTRLMQKDSPWTMICLSNCQAYRDTESWHCFSAWQLNFTWAEAITSLWKALLKGFKQIFPVCKPKGYNSYALHYYGELTFSVGKPYSALRSKPTWTARHQKKKKKGHKHSWDNSNSNAEAALLS